MLEIAPLFSPVKKSGKTQQRPLAAGHFHPGAAPEGDGGKQLDQADLVKAAKAEKVKDYVGKTVIMGIRPEDMYDDADTVAKYSETALKADVEVTELMGAETYLYTNCEGQAINARVAPTNTARPGDKIKIALETSKIHIFDKDTELTICN